jgi:hypothetical protein
VLSWRLSNNTGLADTSVPLTLNVSSISEPRSEPSSLTAIQCIRHEDADIDIDIILTTVQLAKRFKFVHADRQLLEEFKGLRTEIENLAVSCLHSVNVGDKSNKLLSSLCNPPLEPDVQNA